jgi:multidrug efflux system membrane fusion protein
MKRGLVAASFVVVLAIVAGFAWPHLSPSSRAPATKAATAAVPVTVAPAKVASMPVQIAAVGNVDPYTSVAVKARVDGQIVRVSFKEGDRIRKDQVLFEIDPRPLQAALAQARANLAKDHAQLERARAQDMRYQDLLKQNFISKDAYEQMRTNAQTADATVQADQAAVDNAQLQLGFCTIRAPIDGFAGRILIQEGNLVKANDTSPLVTINQIVPVYVTFAVPEQDLAAIREHERAGELRVAASLPGSHHPPLSGRLSFIDNAADTTTGTIKLRAQFANEDTALWPGQFANVVLTVYEQPDALVVPSQAVQNGPNGQYVFVVKPDQTVELREVTVARAVGDKTVIAKGLAAGDVVVTVGQLRLAPGVKVALDSKAG